MTSLLSALPHPIVQAPMAGGGSTAAMAAEVSDAGGLGSIAAAYLSGAALRAEAEAVRARTARPFAINLFCDTRGAAPPDTLARAHARLAPYREELGLEQPAAPALPADDRDEQLAALFAVRPAVFSFTFGIPEPAVLARCRAERIATLGTATTVAEAIALERAGVDMICAQGAEAGAHRGTFLGPVADALIGTLALVPQIVDAVRVPVVAAGGIGDGRGVAAVLALGAAAAQIGTAYLLADEASISAPWRAALTGDAVHRTAITTAFSGRAARGIRNRFLDELEGDASIAPFPYQNAMTRDIRAACAAAGRADFLSLWAGQAAALARPGSARALTERIAAEARGALARAGAVMRV